LQEFETEVKAGEVNKYYKHNVKYYKDMDANIKDEKGLIVLDFRQPISKQEMYRDVQYIIRSDGILSLQAKRANFVEFHANASSFHGNRYVSTDEKWFDKVLPEYMEDWERPALSWYERPVFGGKEWKTPKMIRRVKPGWVELKKTNRPIEILATNFLIMKDGESFNFKA